MTAQQVRVLHIVGDSKFGGGSVIVHELARMAKEMNWHVDVLTTDRQFIAVLQASGIGVVDLPCIWRAIHPFRDLVGLWRLYTFLKHKHYSLVHTHTSKAGFVGRLAAKAAGIPAILHTVHGFSFHERSPCWVIAIASTLEKIAALCCDKLITVSQVHCDLALELGIGSRDKVIAIPNGISLDRVKPHRQRESVRKSIGVKAGEQLLIAIGRCAPQKGFEYLLEAAELLKLQGTIVRVALVGDGPLRKALQTQASAAGLNDTVEFLGHRDDVGDLLHAADLIVLPSIREGLSIALLEAMAAEKTIVATDIPSNSEATAAGETARLVPPANSAALANAITHLLAHPLEATELARRAKARVHRHYTVRRMLSQYEALYREVLRTTHRVYLPDLH